MDSITHTNKYQALTRRKTARGLTSHRATLCTEAPYLINICDYPLQKSPPYDIRSEEVSNMKKVLISLLCLMAMMTATPLEAAGRCTCKHKRPSNCRTDFDIDGNPNFDQKAVAVQMYAWGFGLAAFIAAVSVFITSSPAPTTSSSSSS